MIEGMFQVEKKSFQNGKSEMDTRSLVLDCALPGIPGESRQSALVRASEASGLSYARIVAFFYKKGNPPQEAREKLEEAARVQRALWQDMTRRQDIARIQTSIRKTRENVAEIKRRAMESETAAEEGGEAERQGRFLFWLGSETPGLDR